MGALYATNSFNEDHLPAGVIDDAQAAVLGKAFWRLCSLYEFNREEQAMLLGIKANRERLLALEKQQTVPVDPDKFARVGHLLGIHKNLRILFPHNRDAVYRWMRTPRELFGGLSAMAFIAQEPVNSLPRLFTVRRVLDQIRCA